MIEDYAPRRFSVEEFDKMIAAGILAPDERVDLVEGHLVSYAPPHGAAHAGTVWAFTGLLSARLRERAVLWSQLPVVLREGTELEPDVALLKTSESYRSTLPRARDVHAVIEVADSSLFRDRVRKRRLYAAAGIPEYWVVAIRQARIEIAREPRNGAYASYRSAVRGDTVTFEAFPDVVFTVDELLG